MDSGAYILSIDVGLRNLAMCLMEQGSIKIIHLWDVFDTLGDDNHLCQSIQKSGKICNKKCGYKYSVGGGVKHVCKTHFPSNLNPITPNNIYKKKLIKSYLLQDICKIVLSKVDEIYNNNKEMFLKLNNIVIELQPKCNQKMKFTSHVIYGKLVELMKDTKCNVRFVRASQKLKAYKGPFIECKLKGAYAQRKWLSVQYTKWFLKDQFDKTKWLEIFDSHSKKDDLADTFLMAINQLDGIPKKSKSKSLKGKM